MIVNVALVVFIAYTLSKLTWAFVPQPDAALVPPVKQTHAAPQQSRQQKDPTTIARLNLFGIENAPTPTTTVVEKGPAPVTPLKFVLKGILFDTDSNQARALIEDESRKEDVYKKGDIVQGKATVEDILSDRVILKRGGKREELRLPDAPDTPTQTASRTNRAPKPSTESEDGNQADANLPGGSAGSLQDLRERLLNNPDSLAEALRVSPVSKGQEFLGFRVSPGSKPELFGLLGLRSGDIITAVDEVLLDSPTKGFDVIEKLATASSLNLTVKRGRREQKITVRFN